MLTYQFVVISIIRFVHRIHLLHRVLCRLIFSLRRVVRGDGDHVWPTFSAVTAAMEVGEAAVDVDPEVKDISHRLGFRSAK